MTGKGKQADIRAGARHASAGFTLIELIAALIVSAVVVSIAALFLSQPVLGFTDQARRGRLVDSADNALGHIGRDIRRTPPNGIRIPGDGTALLELHDSADGARGGPVSYVCDSAAGTLMRYRGYPIAASPADRDSPAGLPAADLVAADLAAAGASASLLTRNVAACRFRYAPPAAAQPGLVTIELTLGDQGETISLLNQVHVDGGRWAG